MNKVYIGNLILVTNFIIRGIFLFNFFHIMIKNCLVRILNPVNTFENTHRKTEDLNLH